MCGMRWSKECMRTLHSWMLLLLICSNALPLHHEEPNPMIPHAMGAQTDGMTVCIRHLSVYLMVDACGWLAVAAKAAVAAVDCGVEDGDEWNVAAGDAEGGYMRSTLRLPLSMTSRAAMESKASIVGSWIAAVMTGLPSSVKSSNAFRVPRI